VLEHVRVLSVDIGPRVSGTSSEIVARDFLVDVLESYGYDVDIQEFAFDASLFRPVRVEIDGEAVLGIGLEGTAVATITAPVVAAGAGRPEDFPAGGLEGSIALMQRGDLTFRDKVVNAIEAGAAGVLIFNNESGDILGNLDEDVGVPVAGLRREVGDELVQRLSAGETIEATIDVDELGASFNVVARPPGTTTCQTVTGGHFDTVPITGGANDNASGTAAVLEAARVVAARGTVGAHCFVLFGAEEFGLFGSKHFVSMLSAEELDALRGMVNLDVVGLPQELELIGSEDLVAQAGLIADGMGLPWRPSSVPNGLGSDHASFLNAGVPVVFLYRNDPLIHTVQDEISRISVDSLEQTVAVALAMLADLGE
jgi:Zn-dependent M28 family amino/carboxypeptidase